MAEPEAKTAPTDSPETETETVEPDAVEPETVEAEARQAADKASDEDIPAPDAVDAELLGVESEVAESEDAESTEILAAEGFEVEATQVEAAEVEAIEAETVDSAAEADTNVTPDDDATPDEGEGEAADEAATVERTALVMNAVKIRGRPGGVAIEIGEGEWSELLAVLRERLEMAEGFFRGGRVVLDVGERAVDETQLQKAFDILVDFEMQMAVVRADTESALEAAAALGVTATTGEVEDPLRGVVEAHAEEEAEQAPTYYVHQGNLRSGQVLERTESVIVIGDVNPGAQVVSSGDVLIWGRLRGSAHAGAEGDEQAMVTAMEFAPTQLRIAGFTSVPPEDKKQSGGLLFWKKETGPHGAEFAYVAEGRIYVEPWNPSKPGGLHSRRRL